MQAELKKGWRKALRAANDKYLSSGPTPTLVDYDEAALFNSEQEAVDAMIECGIIGLAVIDVKITTSVEPVKVARPDVNKPYNGLRLV